MTDTLAPEAPKTEQAPAKITDIREIAPPLVEDRGIMDPGQTYTRHLAMASGSAQALAGQGLGFRARCALIDNFTNQYVYFPEAESWVPPYVVGYRILLTPTTIGRCDTSSTARGTVTQITPITGELAIVTWCEKVILSTPVILSAATRSAP